VAERESRRALRRWTPHRHVQEPPTLWIRCGGNRSPETSAAEHLLIVAESNRLVQRRRMVEAAERVGIEHVHHRLLGNGGDKRSSLEWEDDWTCGSKIEVSAVEVLPIRWRKRIDDSQFLRSERHDPLAQASCRTVT